MSRRCCSPSLHTQTTTLLLSELSSPIDTHTLHAGSVFDLDLLTSCQGRCHGVDWGGHGHPTLFPEGVSGIESLWSVLISFRLYPRPYVPTWEGHPSPQLTYTLHPTLFDLATPPPFVDRLPCTGYLPSLVLIARAVFIFSTDTDRHTDTHKAIDATDQRTLPTAWLTPE